MVVSKTKKQKLKAKQLQKTRKRVAKAYKLKKQQTGGAAAFGVYVEEPGFTIQAANTIPGLSISAKRAIIRSTQACS
jgi:hypothetical protein